MLQHKWKQNLNKKKQDKPVTKTDVKTEAPAKKVKKLKAETPVAQPVDQQETTTPVVVATSTENKPEGEDKKELSLKFDSQFGEIQNEIKTMREKLQALNANLKKLGAAYHHDVKKVSQRRPKRAGPHKLTGFAKAQKVSARLAKFIGVNAGTELSGPEITSRVWKQLKDRNLTYEKDKRVFRTNKEVTEIFGVPAKVNKSTNHRDKEGFNFCNLQTYISQANKSE